MNIISDERLKHPNYKLMELNGIDLEKELKNKSRIELIEWLCWNDSNGVYDDEQSLREFGNVVSKKEAIEIIIKQIKEGQL
jgi:hypothetical protein